MPKKQDNFKICAFNFWECGVIGINIVNGGTLTAYDLTLEEAEKLISQLHSAITEFKSLDCVC